MRMSKMKLLLLVLALLPAASFLGQAATQSVVPKKLIYDKEYTADEILNGTLPGRPASPPPLPVSFNMEGFAADRVFHLPAPGVHPRILFSPEDLPGIRQRLQKTKSGRQMLAYVRLQLANGIDKPGTWENHLYNDLLNGDVRDFSALYKPGNSALPGAAENIKAAELKPATKWHHRDPFGVAMELKAFVCMLDNDQREGARLGKALATWAQYYKPRAQAAAASRYGNNWWRSMRDAIDQWPMLPYAYDWDYNYMTPEQRTAVRDVLSLATKGRYSLGMDLPSHWRNWNFLGMSMYEMIFALAIEGEPGYDPRIYKRGTEVIRDFLAYAINPSGMAHESIGYHTAAIGHFSQMMIAMANRGDNYFTQSRYRAQFDEWFLQTLQPYGQEWFSDGDLGNFPPSDEALMTAKYFYPDDAKLDYVFQNTKAVQTDNFGSDFFMETMLITAQDPRRDADGKLWNYHAGSDFKLPDSYYDEHRGVLITRSEWTKDALYLNFECHPDTVFASHDHADRGRFVLSGAGRNWALQDSRPHETGETNSILIDGKGQGYFATPAKWLGITDAKQATFAGCDVKYPYDWNWRKEAGMWDPTDSRLREPHYASLNSNDGAKGIDRSTTEYDPSPSVVEYYANYLRGNPLMWDEDSWVVRQPYNPVHLAFRSAGMVRGDHAYALVVDDLQKDDESHLYSWVMQLEDDVYLKQQSIQNGILDITLAEKKGNRRLLLRVFDPVGLDTAKGAHTENFGADYRLAGLQAQTPTMYRLVIPTKTVAYRSKVLMFAYHEGEALPASRWDAKDGSATVDWDGQHDTIHFQQAVDGRTNFTVQRNGKELLTVK